MTLWHKLKCSRVLRLIKSPGVIYVYCAMECTHRMDSTSWLNAHFFVVAVVVVILNMDMYACMLCYVCMYAFLFVPCALFLYFFSYVNNFTYDFFSTHQEQLWSVHSSVLHLKPHKLVHVVGYHFLPINYFWQRK